jgi:hypothetical protein
MMEKEIIQKLNDWDEEWRIPEIEPEKETEPEKYPEEREQGEQGNDKEYLHGIPPLVSKKMK